MSDNVQQDDTNTYEDEEKIEITDDEGEVEVDEGTEEAGHFVKRPQTPIKSSSQTPTKSLSGIPGRIEPSKQVRNMKLKFPESLARSSLPVDKNPFLIFGFWTETSDFKT